MRRLQEGLPGTEKGVSPVPRPSIGSLRRALMAPGNRGTGGGSVAEEGQTVHDREGPEAGATGAYREATVATRMSRLQRRLQPEPINAFALLTTEEIQQALALTERGGVLPDGDVRHPEAFREATPVEQEAMQHW